MELKNIEKATFLSRPNRFCANVLADGCEQTVHVKNTGRLRELLVPGASVLLSRSDNENRKTKYDLVAVQKGKVLVSIDSQAANGIAEEWLKKGVLFGKDATIRREVTFGKSRFDFYIESEERKIFLEVKGCTLERDGVALFPDAPTERGVKHINELCQCIEKGFEAYILFVIQRKGISHFSPNDVTHPEFGQALRNAESRGVKILAVDCKVSENSVTACDFVDVVL